MRIVHKRALYIALITMAFVISFEFQGQAALNAEIEQKKFVNLDIEDGLSNNSIAAMFKDSRGFMWIGTNSGLNRYDGEQVKQFVHNVNDSTSIPFKQIRYIFEDCEKQLWIRDESFFTIYNPFLEAFSSPPATFKGTGIPLSGLRRFYKDSKGNTWLLNTNNTLYKYNDTSAETDSIPISVLGTQANNYVNRLSEDSKGNLWLISYIGELIQINPESKEVLKQIQIGDPGNELLIDYQIFIDSQDKVWIFSKGLTIGVYVYDAGTSELKHLKHSENGNGISSNMVADVIEDENGLIWIGMDHGGINILDKDLNIVSTISSRSDDKHSLVDNSINCLYRDNENIMWIGTFKKGISYYHKELIRFQHYKHSAELPNSLPFNDINCFAEDKYNNIWIGTNGNGLIYFDRSKNTFTNFKNDPGDSNSLSNNVIICLHIDREENLWVGTYQGGLNKRVGDRFIHYSNDPGNSSSISDNRIWDIFEDSKRNLWVGTFNGGLNLFDRQKNTFQHFKAGDNSLTSNFVLKIIEDSENKLWMGTTHGLSVLDLETYQFHRYPPDPNSHGGLSGQHANFVHEDVRGLIWAATSHGINVLNKSEGKFKTLTELDGLVSSNTLTILEDTQGNLWVSSFKGISKISVKNYSSQNPIAELEVEIENFGVQDGLQGHEFNQKAAYRTRSGELLYGGTNGFNLLTPETISDFEPMERIVLTNFKVFNQDVKANTPFRDRIILEKSITYVDKISLQSKENVFSIAFTSLNYFDPEKSKFQYMLKGFNDEWLDVNKGFNEITFTNLDAGSYELYIRSSKDKSNWKQMEAPLTIVILPPFWKSKYAYVLYFLIFVLLLFIAWKTLSERQRLKFLAEQEHLEAERMQQVDALKTKFFTNISHEFKTPLSLIISPLEKLIEKSKNENQRNHLLLIHRNAKRLLGMVNQLLDFRKMELQKLEVKESWGELIAFVKDIGSTYQDLVQNKKITYRFSSSCDTFYTYFDKDKIDKVVSNLLSNAFKFTPENGEVSVEIQLVKKSEQAELSIIVNDTGIGIVPDQQKQIFERFYQSQLSVAHINQGSGIGLSMVKEYVSLMNGKVNVQSEVTKGSIFTVTLPLRSFSLEEIEQNNLKAEQEDSPLRFTVQATDKEENTVFDSSKKTMAIVEDNFDFRFYLKDNLKQKYNILEAENGLKGWELIENQKPDIVVSDVMMPEMDGIELCKKVKSNRGTKHIPIVLLTAKTEDAPVLAGYESGADSYIAKPFDFKILESRIANLLHTRDQLRLSYQSMIGLNPEKVEVNSEDEQFIKKALQIVEDKIAEASFTVEDFGMEMGMSRVSLYKKLLALTDKSPIEFIRIIRLKRAADLLTTSQLSVSEVAYQVGFNNPRYFSKYFSKEYNMLPSEYIIKHRKNDTEISEKTKEKYS